MSNDFYNPSGWPIQLSFGASVTGRSEMTSIQAGFDKLPTLTGNGGKIAAINSGGTAMEAKAVTGTGSVVLATGPTISGGVFNGTLGSVTPAAASVTTLAASGAVSGAGFTAYMASPPAIGGTAPAAGAFTTLSAAGLMDISGASAGQIKFPASQNASANANTLDDYEEGTWTPDLTFATPGSQTFVKDASTYGTYTKIGRRVFCDMFLYYTTFTWSGANGSAKVTGLPFTVGSNGSCGTMGTSGNTLNALYRGLFANVVAGQTYFTPYVQLADADGPMSTTDFPSGLSYLFIRASFSYEV